MIDFKGLDKTQIKYVELDCPDHKILRDITHPFINSNPILNRIINSVIANCIGIDIIDFKEINDYREIQNIIKNYYGYGRYHELTQSNLLSFIKDNKFNTKSNRALLTEIFGNKVHEEDFMANLQFVISQILYAILYV